jgi:transcriptional regulator with XRE-family HTH domain
MAKRKSYRRTFIRQWRVYRNLTLEQLAERVEMTPSGLSMLERGQSGYTQLRLEQLAEALSTDPASLLMRDPTDPEAIWSIWDNASPVEKRQITEIAAAIKRAAKAS